MGSCTHVDRYSFAGRCNPCCILATTLTPEEFRFLRTYLELSQRKLGESLGTTDQTIANWEKGKSAVDRPAETLLRMLVREHRGGNIVVRQFIERLNASDHSERRRTLTFRQSRKTWRRDPKAA